jgi:hypothetical protein
MKSYTNRDLVEYIEKYPGTARETVLNQLLRSDILGEFLNTSAGKLVLENAIDMIVKDVAKIVELSVSSKKDEIVNVAQEIKMYHDFMLNLAKVALAGDEHIKRMKKEE